MEETQTHKNFIGINQVKFDYWCLDGLLIFSFKKLNLMNNKKTNMKLVPKKQELIWNYD
jgi:hypothetical protein